MKNNISFLAILGFFFYQTMLLNGQNWAGATRFSSSNNDMLDNSDIAIGADGFTYVAGNFQNTATFGSVTIAAPAPNRNHGFLLKLDPQMQPVWAKVFPQRAIALAVDAQDNVFVAGSHWSWVAPDDSLAYVAKYDNNGTLLASFSASGTAETWAKAVYVDAAGNCYLAGERASPGVAIFGGISPAPIGGRECFLLKLSPNLAQVQWATYTGQSPNLDNLYSIDVDEANNFVYTAGNYSQNFDLGCFCYIGDFYVEKHNAATGVPVWKKIFSGGSGDDTKQFVQIDPGGQTLSVAATFKKTTVFLPTLSLTADNQNLDYHIFLAKVNTLDASVQWAEKISTAGDAFLWGMAQKNGDIWLHGHYQKPITAGTFPLSLSGSADAFLLKASASNGNVAAAERLWGNASELGLGLDVRGSDVVVSGESSSPTLNIGTFGLTGTAKSIYIARKGNLAQSPPVAAFAASVPIGCPSLLVQFSNSSTGGATAFSWQFPGGTPATSTDPNPSVTYSTPGTYSVTLTASNAAGDNTVSQTDFVNILPPPTADFATSLNGLTATFSDSSANAVSYLWDFGDGSSSTDPAPAHSYMAGGSYSVILVVANVCGATDTLTTLVSVASPPAVVLAAGEVEGNEGEIALIPIYAIGCANLTSLQGQVSLESLGVAQVLGIVNGEISPIFSTSDTSCNFSWFGNADITDTTALFWVEVLLIGNPGDSTAVNFADAPFLAIEISCGGALQTVGLQSGMVRIKPKANLSITAVTCNSEPIRLANATIIALQDGAETSYTGITDSTGICTTDSIVPGSQITIVLSKEINPLNGLATAFCLYQMQRFILGFSNTMITSPCQVVAADWNGDNVASTFDLFQISTAAVNGNGEPAPFKSWVFTPKSHIFPSPFTPTNVFPYPTTHHVGALTQDTTADFIGIKIGSICMTADPQNLAPGGSESRDVADLDLVATPFFDQATRRLSVSVSSKEGFDMVSFQAEIGFDQSKLRLVEVQSGSISPVYKIGEASLPIVWFDQTGEGQAAGTAVPILTLVFETSADFDAAQDITELIWLKEDGLRTELYAMGDVRRWPQLVFDSPVLSQANIAAKGFRVGTPMPNPASAEMTLPFYLPQPEAVTLTLTNALGQIALVQNARFEVGQQSFKVDVSGLPVGVYYCTLATQKASATVKASVFH